MTTLPLRDITHYGKYISTIYNSSNCIINKYAANETQYAIKIANSEDKEINLNEISILKLLKHENIVEIIDVVIVKNSVSCIVESLAPYDIMEAIITYKYRYDIEMMKKITYQILCALKYIHCNNILHGDIKPSNILYYDINNIRLADFEHSLVLSPGGNSESNIHDNSTNECNIHDNSTNNRNSQYNIHNNSNNESNIYDNSTNEPHIHYYSNSDTVLYTLRYRPPELLFSSNYRIYDHSCDIWAAGLSFYEIWFGRPLLNGETIEEQKSLITDMVMTDNNHQPLSKSLNIANRHNNDERRPTTDMVITDTNDQLSQSLYLPHSEYRLNMDKRLRKKPPFHELAYNIVVNMINISPKNRPTTNILIQNDFFSSVRGNGEYCPEPVSSIFNKLLISSDKLIVTDYIVAKNTYKYYKWIMLILSDIKIPCQHILFSLSLLKNVLSHFKEINEEVVAYAVIDVSLAFCRSPYSLDYEDDENILLPEICQWREKILNVLNYDLQIILSCNYAIKCGSLNINELTNAFITLFAFTSFEKILTPYTIYIICHTVSLYYYDDIIYTKSPLTDILLQIANYMISDSDINYIFKYVCNLDLTSVINKLNAMVAM